MFPYRFVISVVPTVENEHYQVIAGADAHILVFDGEMDAALLRAKAYLTANHWTVEKVEYAFEIQLEQPLDLDASEALLHRRAIEQGFAADFVAWPHDG